MTYEDKVIEYIAQPENLPVALEVADAVQNLRESIHRQFWPFFSEQYQEKLFDSEYTEQWKYFPFPITHLKKEYEISILSPIRPKEQDSSALLFIFGQGSRENHYRLLMGVAWNGVIGDPNHPALNNLKRQLISQQLTTSWEWWPGWKYLDYSLGSGEFMLKFYHTPKEVVTELAEEFWQLFLELRPTIESINQELAK